jgi:hypothetical protein
MKTQKTFTEKRTQNNPHNQPISATTTLKQLNNKPHYSEHIHYNTRKAKPPLFPANPPSPNHNHVTQVIQVLHTTTQHNHNQPDFQDTQTSSNHRSYTADTLTNLYNQTKIQRNVKQMNKNLSHPIQVIHSFFQTYMY